jgi:uncharacterized protein (TIGR02996 family)
LKPEALLADVLADPDSDEKRLVYADYLSGIGEPRGELIEVQVALARASLDDDAYPSLLRRSDELRATTGIPAPWRMRRGFVDRAQILDDDFELGLKALLATEPVRGLTSPVVDTPLLAWIERLDLDDPEILESPHLRELRELTIPRPIDAVAAMRIAALPELTVLEVVTYNLDEDSIGELVRMPMLRELRLSGGRLPESNLGELEPDELAMQNVDLGRLLPRLRSATSVALPDERQAGTVAAWDGLARLESLSIASRDPDEIRAILGSPHLAGGTLRRLRLHAERLESDEVTALGTLPALVNLHYLDLHAPIPPAGLDGFARLVALDVAGRIDHAAARALVLGLPRCGRLRFDDSLTTTEGDAILRNRFPPVRWTELPPR